MTHEFSHKMVLGMTTCGKTTLVANRVKVYRRHKQQVICYAGNGDTPYKDVQYVYSADELEAALGNPENYGAFIIIDEAATLFDEARSSAKYPLIYSLTRAGRHRGYTAWFITQYPTGVPPAIRRGCAERYLFMQADEEDADAIWRDCSKVKYQGVALSERLMHIPKYAYFHFNRNTLELTFHPP